MRTDSDLIRTNIRVSRELHGQLKRAAASHDETVEIFAAKLIEQGLLSQAQQSADPSNTSPTSPAQRRQFMQWVSHLRKQADEIEHFALDTPGAVLERLAQSFARFSPALMVIKDRSNRIITANPAYLRLVKPGLDLQAALAAVRGVTLESALGLDSNQDHLVITHRRGSFSESFEHIQIKETTIDVLALQFSIEASWENEELLVGDVSFHVDHLNTAREHGTYEYASPSQVCVDFDAAGALWSHYLRSLNTPALIKSAHDGRIVWSNRSFINLVGEFYEKCNRPAPPTPISKTSAQLFGEYADPRLFSYEKRAVAGIATLASETLRSQERIGARFPIYSEDGQVEYVGIISSSEGRFPTSKGPTSLEPAEAPASASRPPNRRRSVQTR